MAEKDRERKEILQKITVHRPISTDLYYGQSDLLRKDLLSNNTLETLSLQRRDLAQKLRGVFDKIDDVTLDFSVAREQGLISQHDLDSLYTSLSDFFDADIDHSRLLLYLPLQLLPIPSTQAEFLFSAHVKKAWRYLLSESDVRASFIDGDVLEPGLGEPARVRKAAHLTPFLLDKGILDQSDIEAVINSAKAEDDQDLISDLQEAVSFHPGVTASREAFHGTVDDLVSKFDAAIDRIELSFAPESSYVKKVSQKRVIWEKKEKTNEALEISSLELSPMIRDDALTTQDLSRLSDSELHRKLLFRATVKAGSDEKITDLATRWWREADTSLKDELISGLLQARNAGIISDDFLTRFGVTMPDLASPVPIDPEKLARDQYSVLTQTIKEISTNEAVGEHLFPFFLLIGSQVKGIASLGSDKDAALFWKPGTTLQDRFKVISILKNSVPSLQEMDSMPEIWLDEINGKFAYRKDISAPNMVSPGQIHFLFGGVWMGEGKDMKKVASDLLSGYLDLDRLGDTKDETHSYLLRRLEMDSLMYRLMHKGFRRFYLSQKKDYGETGKKIDWQSSYWEPEYRRLATQLFLNKVFLPDLGHKKAPI